MKLKVYRILCVLLACTILLIVVFGVKAKKNEAARVEEERQYLIEESLSYFSQILENGYDETTYRLGCAYYSYLSRLYTTYYPSEYITIILYTTSYDLLHLDTDLNYQSLEYVIEGLEDLKDNPTLINTINIAYIDGFRARE